MGLSGLAGFRQNFMLFKANYGQLIALGLPLYPRNHSDLQILNRKKITKFSSITSQATVQLQNVSNLPSIEF